MRPDTYRYLIKELVEVVKESGGYMRVPDAEVATARRLGISVADMQGVVIKAHADRALVYDLRDNSVTWEES